MKRYTFTFFFLVAVLVAASFNCRDGNGGGNGGGNGDKNGDGNGNGNGGAGAPPETPGNFTAVASVTSRGQVTLNWDSQDGLTYTLFHSTTPGVDVNDENTPRFPDVTPPYIHRDLTNNTTYYYRLTAVNSSGASEPTAEVSATPSFPPLAPQNFTATASDRQVTLDWDSQDSLTYILFHSTTPGVDVNDANTSMFPDVTPPYIHRDLTNNTTYYYRLRAVNSSGASEPTSEMSATPISPPAVPQNFTATAFDRQVTLNWDSQDGLTYTLFHSTTPGVDVNDENTSRFSDVTPPHIHRNLTNNTTYYYRLRAVNSSGASEPTAEMSATPRLRAKQISAGRVNHTCAVVSGRALCWGAGGNGQLGNNNTETMVTPQQVAGLETGVTQISAGTDHTCAVANGAAKCWGNGIRGGALGAGRSASFSLAPVQVIGLETGVTQISAVNQHTCAVANGAAFCWGNGGSGRLGDGSESGSRYTPHGVIGLTSGVTQISAGTSHTCAVVGGSAKCWGANNSGRLGTGDLNDTSTPKQVYGLTTGVEQISAGNQHACAVVEGRALCWGLGNNGRLGHNEMPQTSMDGMTTGGPNADKSRPTQVYGLTSGVTQISAGISHTCAVVRGRAVCWGLGSDGRLGDGMTMTRNTPQQVVGLTTGVTQISAGADHTCAVVNERAVCWGKGSAGQLGHNEPTETINGVMMGGPKTDKSTPTLVDGF